MTIKDWTVGDTCNVLGVDKPQVGTVEKVGRKIITVRVSPYRTFRFDVSKQYPQCVDSDYAYLVTHQEMAVRKAREAAPKLLREATEAIYQCKDIARLEALTAALKTFLGQP